MKIVQNCLLNEWILVLSLKQILINILWKNLQIQILDCSQFLWKSNWIAKTVLKLIRFTNIFEGEKRPAKELKIAERLHAEFLKSNLISKS